MLIEIETLRDLLLLRKMRKLSLRRHFQIQELSTQFGLEEDNE